MILPIGPCQTPILLWSSGHPLGAAITMGNYRFACICPVKKIDETRLPLWVNTFSMRPDFRFACTFQPSLLGQLKDHRRAGTIHTRLPQKAMKVEEPEVGGATNSAGVLVHPTPLRHPEVYLLL